MERLRRFDTPLVSRALKAVSQAHVWLYRRLDGRVVGSLPVGNGFLRPLPVCLLTHTGRRTGRELTTPLLFLPDGDRVVLVAAQGGLPRNPQWYQNLVADPDCAIRVGDVVRRMRARIASAEERADLWPRLVDHYPGWGRYQSRTDRVIPVVVCEPA